ncbi:hypothetical protein COV18_02870, partial [Candidatus Woesearchaeota archaeon CG10_big_fil_rev_8_21_14_0_10_37_12]
DKSKLFLHYIARAAERVMNREIARRKVELSINQLKKLSTKNLQKQIEDLEGQIDDVVDREKAILGTQSSEEKTHTVLKKKIGNLEGKLGRYLETQEQRKARIKELEEKIKDKFETKKEKIAKLKDDYQNLQKLHQAVKSSKAPKEKLERVQKRMNELRAKIKMLS